MINLKQQYPKEWIERIGREEAKSSEIMCESMWNEFEPESVLDFGSGPGNHINGMHHRMEIKNATAIDGVSDCENYLSAGINFCQLDFRNRFAPEGFEGGKQFDLVMCYEVIEHIEEEFEEILLDNIVLNAGKYLCISAAKPGQPGNHHVNCKPIDYWLRAFIHRGFKYLDKVTESFQASWRKQGVRYYFIDNLLVFENAKSGSEI